MGRPPGSSRHPLRRRIRHIHKLDVENKIRLGRNHRRPAQFPISQLIGNERGGAFRPPSMRLKALIPTPESHRGGPAETESAPAHPA